MSNTFRKYPGVKSTGARTGKFFKRKANKKVRKEDVANGCNFKKVYESYNIVDYKLVAFKEEDTEWLNEKERKSKHKAKMNNEIHSKKTIRKGG